jgi:hypothetical protein
LTDPTDRPQEPAFPPLLQSFACQLDNDFASKATFAVFHFGGRQVIYEWFRPETEVALLIQFVEAMVHFGQFRLKVRGPDGRVLPNILMPRAKLSSFLREGERTVHFAVE